MGMFTLLHKDTGSSARTGTITTDHGSIQTPCFMPVGTQATVKALDIQDLSAIDAQIILGNTYHLHLRPGEDTIANFGGLHGFMNWRQPILTDSGGFQVFSLGNKKQKNQKTTEHEQLVSIDEDGVTFRSHIDGSKQRFTPESAMELQHKLGADIIMAFDECTPDSASKQYTQEAMDRTHRWAKRCVDFHKANKGPHGHKQFLFGIIQGAKHKTLREESAKAICNMDFDGIALGGESVGFNMQATTDILDWVSPLLPEDMPRYTMGVGHMPSDIFTVVERGIDMFDCVSPTRIARNGMLYIRPANGKQTMNILNTQYKLDGAPIDPTCDCFTCTNHSRAYLHHLFKADELLAYRLATIHNLRFLMQLMQDIRDAIQEDRFLELKKQWTT